MIYYGDEVGMTGGKIEQRRAPMIWDEDKRDMDLFDWYKKLIKIRKNNIALQLGDFKLLGKGVATNTYSFIRKKNNNLLLMIFHNSRLSTKLKFDLQDISTEATKFKELISNQEYVVENGKIIVSVEEYSVNILRAEY